MNLQSWKIVLDRVCRRLITRIERSGVDSSPQQRKKRASQPRECKMAIGSRLKAACFLFFAHSRSLRSINVISSDIY